MKFYPHKWAKYEEEITGTIKFVPPLYRFDSPRNDYEYMSEMIFGQYPSFDDSRDCVHSLKNEINTLYK